MPAPMGHPPYNKNGEGGRPKIWTDERIEEEAIALEEWNKNKENIFIQDFCLERGYHDGYVNEWAKVNERFNAAYKIFNTKQKVVLFRGSLSKKFAHPMTALLLSHSHGIHLKTEQKVTSTNSDSVSLIMQAADGQSKDLVPDGKD